MTTDSPQKCPSCGAPSRPEHAPFCSKRCQQVDLHRWMSGGYRVITDETAENSGSEDKE